MWDIKKELFFSSVRILITDTNGYKQGQSHSLKFVTVLSDHVFYTILTKQR